MSFLKEIKRFFLVFHDDRSHMINESICVSYLLFGDVSAGFDGGGAILIEPGGGGNAPVAFVRVLLDDSAPSFFCNYQHTQTYLFI